MTTPPLVSRILLIVGALAVIGLSYWFIRTSLAPVAIPPVSVTRSAATFDPAADVTKNATFDTLHPLGPDLITPTVMGREDPFAPVPVTSIATTSTGTATSTVAATSTVPDAMMHMETTSTPVIAPAVVPTTTNPEPQPVENTTTPITP